MRICFGISILGFRVLQFASGFALVRILGADCKGDSAACGELRGHNHFARSTGFYEIVENAVRDRFVEGALVTIGGKIEF